MELKLYGAAAARKCGECSACCHILKVEEIEKAAGAACDLLHPSGGCGVHGGRLQPKSCRDFRCTWLAGLIDPSGKVPWAQLRPDRCGIMLGGRDSADVGFAWHAYETFAGGADTPTAQAMIRVLSAAELVVIIPHDQSATRRVRGPAHRLNLVQRVAEEAKRTKALIFGEGAK